MRKVFSSLVVTGLVALAGCNTSPTGGGNPTTPSGTKGPTGHAATFTINGWPKTTHTMKRDSSEDFKLTLDRGKDFKEDVTFTATVEPPNKGVTAVPEPKTVKASDPGTVTVKVTVGDKPAPGSYKILLDGKPAVGEHTGVSWEVKVPEPPK